MSQLREPQLRPVAYKPVSEVLLTSTFGYNSHLQSWADALREHGLTVRVHGIDGALSDADLSAVEFAAVYNPPPGLLARCPALKLIHSMGAGIAPGMLAEELCPPHVPLLRMVDPLHAERMAVFCLGAIISWQRNFDAYLAAQQARRWDKSIDNFQFRDCALVRVGIMGAGNMGGATARLLLAARYPVSTWTRGPATVAGATCFHGREQLREFVEGNDVVICLVPLTDETSGILNAELFSWLPQGALVINVSRGQHLVEEDLLVALDSGHLSAAVLDVFHQEPLPPESPLWSHPRIRVFPHIAATTPTANAVSQMVRMRELVLRGQPLPPGAVIDRERGY